MWAGSFQAAYAFTVAPALIDQTLDPGDVRHGTVQVRNDTSKPQMYYAVVQNFIPQGEDGQQIFLPEADQSGLAGWLAVDQPVLRLGPGEGREERWSLRIPKDAEPGGHYAALFFSSVPPHAVAGSSVGVGTKTGVLFLVNVNGSVQEHAIVDSFLVHHDDSARIIGKAPILDHLPVQFEIRIRNDGNVHFVPQGKIVITNMFGTERVSLAFNAGASRVLPGSTRRLASVWGENISLNQSFWSQVQAEWANFAFGPYTATIQGVYGPQSLPLVARVSFWIVPWHLFVAGFFLLFLLLALLRIHRRFVIRSAINRGNQSRSR